LILVVLRFATLVLLSCLTLTTHAQTLLTAKTVWAKSRTVGRKVPLQATLTVTIWNEQGKTETQSEFVRDGKGHDRWEYRLPHSAHGRIVIHDGTTRWQYEPTRKLLLKSPFILSDTDVEQGDEHFDLKEYRLSLAPKTEAISGRRCLVLKIVPKHPHLGSQTRWIDNQTFCTLKIETRYNNGVPLSRVVYSNVQFPAKVASSVFAVPKAAKIKTIKHAAVSSHQTEAAMARLAQNQGLQTKLPMGFRLRRVLPPEKGKSPTLQFLYSDGLVFLSVFVEEGYSSPTHIPPPWKSVRVGNLITHELTRSHTNIIVWMKQGRRYSVMSRVSHEALREFVRGVLL
jgi:outer membrane lipoprotein-sorting protein